MRQYSIYAFRITMLLTTAVIMGGTAWSSPSTNKPTVMGELTEPWAMKYLPEECWSGEHKYKHGTALKCVGKAFSFYGQPIHPAIVKDLATWTSDSGDQVVSINLSDSQRSNRYCCSSGIRLGKAENDRFPSVSFDTGDGSFSYTYIGKTASNIHLIKTSEWGSGSGVFVGIMLVTFKQDYGVEFDVENNVITGNVPRILIVKLGEIALGDRWSGELSLSGDELFIGKDQGWFAGREYGGRFSEHPEDRTVKIYVSK